MTIMKISRSSSRALYGDKGTINCSLLNLDNIGERSVCLRQTKIIAKNREKYSRTEINALTLYLSAMVILTA